MVEWVSEWVSERQNVYHFNQHFRWCHVWRATCSLYIQKTERQLRKVNAFFLIIRNISQARGKVAYFCCNPLPVPCLYFCGFFYPSEKCVKTWDGIQCGEKIATFLSNTVVCSSWNLINVTKRWDKDNAWKSCLSFIHLLIHLLIHLNNFNFMSTYAYCI